MSDFRLEMFRGIAFLTIICGCLAACQHEEPKHEWIGAFSAHPMSENANHGLSLFGVEQETYHLIGTWMYVNYDVGDRTATPVTIEGAQTSDGAFWPDLKLQVKKEASGNWDTIAKCSNHWWEFSKKRTSVTVGRNSENLRLMVNLDKFQPLIGKYNVGRIVLKSGEASEFELKNLLPPNDEKKASETKK